jgi:hypothetical protein
MANINDYNTTPATPYRKFVDKVEERIKYINNMVLTDAERLEVLKADLFRLAALDNLNDL